MICATGRHRDASCALSQPSLHAGTLQLQPLFAIVKRFEGSCTGVSFVLSIFVSRPMSQGSPSIICHILTQRGDQTNVLKLHRGDCGVRRWLLIETPASQPPTVGSRGMGSL